MFLHVAGNGKTFATMEAHVRLGSHMNDLLVDIQMGLLTEPFATLKTSKRFQAKM